MLGTRDFVWAGLVAALLFGGLQLFPSWSATRFVKERADGAFHIAYSGARFQNGPLIAPHGSSGAQEDLVAAEVVSQRLRVVASDVSFSGRRVRLIVEHQVEEASPQASHSMQAYVELRRSGSEWEFARFLPRRGGEADLSNLENPFVQAIARAREARPPG